MASESHQNQKQSQKLKMTSKYPWTSVLVIMAFESADILYSRGNGISLNNFSCQGVDFSSSKEDSTFESVSFIGHWCKVEIVGKSLLIVLACSWKELSLGNVLQSMEGEVADFSQRRFVKKYLAIR